MIRLTLISVTFIVCLISQGLAEEKTKSPEDVIRTCIEGNPDLKVQNLMATCEGIIADPCLKKESNSTTLGMTSCYREEELVWNSLLNSYYLKIKEKLDKEKFEALTEVQRDWIKLRQKKCLLIHQIFEGSITQIMAGQCTLRETARRTIEFRLMLEELPSG